jgi:membrane fusion protein, multidrug efflux system
MAEPSTLRNTPGNSPGSSPSPASLPAGVPPPDPAGAPASAAAPAAPSEGGSTKRKRLFGLLGAAVLVIGAITALWLWITSDQIGTDDAYVDADLVQVTPLFAGPVAAAYVSNTDLVKKGQLLVLLDDADATIALTQARADLGQVERKVRGYFANDVALSGQVNSREADIAGADAKLASAKADFERARVDLERRQALAASGAVSGDELTQAQNAFATAKAGLQSAKAAREQSAAQHAAAIGQRSVNKALFEGANVEDNPEVVAARAKVAQAELNLSRTRIVAPIDGVIAKNAVQVGQQVQPGELLMSIVPLSAVYVSANYKEAQLRKVRVGQPAKLTSDLYGRSVKYHGKVVGLGGGTGAAFALIPAQNATGNWIKVVQRLPVRIALDPNELAAHPLRVGLSMNVDIDVSQR